MYNRESGIIGEAEALRYLTGQGMKVLEKNYRRAGGEIDLIVRDGDTIVFVEVKARTSPRFARRSRYAREDAQHRARSHGLFTGQLSAGQPDAL